jgi:hypothetical protein
LTFNLSEGVFSNLIIDARVDSSQRLIGWRRHNAAGAVAPWPARPEFTGALCYTSMVLCFRWFFFLRNRGSMGISPRQSSAGGGQQKGVHDDGLSSLTSAAVGAGSMDRTVLKICKMEVTVCVEDHQNGGGGVCRRSSRCWFSTGGFTTVRQRRGAVARVSTPTMRNSSTMRFYL